MLLRQARVEDTVHRRSIVISCRRSSESEKMPELPEVETVRRSILAHSIHSPIIRVKVSGARFRRPLPKNLRRDLIGQRFVDARRHGKLLILETDRRNRLLLHLGMSGRWVVDRAEANAHDHLVLEFGDGSMARFNDRRRFGEVAFYPAAAESQLKERLARLGPDALSPRLSGAYLHRRLQGGASPIKSMLLDQAVVAGLGNIYTCESLFHAGIAPQRAARDVKRLEADRLVAAVKAVLRRAIRRGGSTLDDYRGTEGEMGTFDREFAVFARGGKPCPGCRCHSSIRMIQLKGRSTYWCAARQR
jgi:formamidopyrimidine-DNA glycosylase